MEQSRIKNKYQSGILAMVAYAFLGSLMGVWVRYMGEDFTTFQQVFLRSLVGFLIGLAIFFNVLEYKKLKEISTKDWFFLLLRAGSLVIGIGLFTTSVGYAKLANISVISSIPTTVLLGFLLLREKISFTKLILIIGSFAGVLIIGFDGKTWSFGYGELLAFLSTFFYSFSIITRKWMSDHLSNYELASINTLIVALLALFTSIVIQQEGVIEWKSISLVIWSVVLLAGLTFILLGLFMNIGMKNLESSVVNNIMTLQVVFSAVMGYMMFSEKMSIREVIGSIIIVICAVLISKIKNQNESNTK